MPHQPIVSVCIPAFRRQFLAESISSVLAQTLEDFELIIVDDDSPDDIRGVVEEFGDRRIRFSRNGRRLGIMGNWNRCVDLAQGQYISIFHDDDRMLPDSLARKVAVLDAHPQAGFVHASAHKIDGGGNYVGVYRASDHTADFVKSGADYFQRLFAGDDPVCCPTVLARRSCYTDQGLFDPRLPQTGDWEMWMRWALFYDVAFLHAPTDQYRRHAQNATLTYAHNVAELEAALHAKQLILKKYPDRVPNRAVLRSQARTYYAHEAFARAVRARRQQQYPPARAYLRFALVVHPALLRRKSTWKLFVSLAVGRRATAALRRLRQALHTQP